MILRSSLPFAPGAKIRAFAPIHILNLLSSSMLRFCSLALLCAGACATGSTDPDLQRFLDFTSTYHKTYASQAEFDHRFSVFKKTLATIDARNAAGTLGVHNVTRFADLESSEFAAQNLGGRGHRAGAISKRWPAHAGKPANVDWVAKGAVTPATSQGRAVD